MMSLWDALRMNMMISYQELVRTFLKYRSLGQIIKKYQNWQLILIGMTFKICLQGID